MSEQKKPDPPQATDPQITIHAITPEGFPTRISFTADTVSGMVSMARTVTKKLSEVGWRPDLITEQLTSKTPQQAASTEPPDDAPMFCGYPCSENLDVNGRPKFIYTPDGRIATMKEDKGDLWYSVETEETYIDKKTGEEKIKFDRFLDFQKGDPIPDVKFPEAAWPGENPT